MKSIVNRGAMAAFALAGLVGLGGCVAQERYDDAQISAKHFQKEKIRLENEVARLAEENRKLRNQLEASDVEIRDAGFTEQIDQRLSNLQGILAELGTQPGDVTKFAVDGGYVYRVTDAVLFPLGSAEISADGRKVLDEVAADIKSRPFGKVYVRGHTDNVPVSKPETRQKFPHGNLHLSAERAVEVGAYLAKSGQVDDKRLVVMGFGESDPVAPNDSEGNRRRNRRVDIFVADESAASTATSRP